MVLIPKERYEQLLRQTERKSPAEEVRPSVDDDDDSTVEPTIDNSTQTSVEPTPRKRKRASKTDDDDMKGFGLKSDVGKVVKMSPLDLMKRMMKSERQSTAKPIRKTWLKFHV